MTPGAGGRDPAGTAARERRAHPRVALRRPVQILFEDGAPLRGQLVNLSASGMLVALPRTIPLGREVEVRIDLRDGGEPLLLRAMGIRQENGRPPRVGFHFILPPADAIARIQRLIYG